MMTRTASKLLALTTLILLVVGCASSPTGRSQFLLISPEAAILESEAAYLNTVGALDQEGKLVTDPNTMGLALSLRITMHHPKRQKSCILTMRISTYNIIILPIK